MFRHQGPSRSERHNAILAAYLATVGGFVNSAGCVLIGTFTSHVTGNVGRLANDLASSQLIAAGGAATMIVCFGVGAFWASLVIESQRFSRRPTAYGVALACEAVLLFVFTIVAGDSIHADPRLRDSEALLLCVAMGMQNSLVTRLSGAVVRTTHLTGVVTDLGIETARWFAFWRNRLATRSLVQREPPVVARIRLHATIVGAFLFGAVSGCALALRFEHLTMLLPTAAVAAAAGYAFLNARNAPVRTSHAPHAEPSAEHAATPR
jgi:uncharacterized membrane protein YoaK (UPF0700 family)